LLDPGGFELLAHWDCWSGVLAIAPPTPHPPEDYCLPLHLLSFWGKENIFYLITSNSGTLFWCFLPMRRNQCKCFRNKSVNKGSIFERPKQCFVPISPRIRAEWRNHHSWHSHAMLDHQWKSGRCLFAAQCILFVRGRKSVRSVSRTSF
jgi:hypothetical protein